MKTTRINQSNPDQEFYTQFARRVYTNRFIFGFLGVSVLIFVFFGVLVWFIAFGLCYGFMKLALTFDPPYRLLLRIFRLKDLPPHLVTTVFGTNHLVLHNFNFPSILCLCRRKSVVHCWILLSKLDL